MASLAAALGSERVCCLTGVPGGIGSLTVDSGPRIYRRPRAFAQSPVSQAFGWGATFAEIMFRDNPSAVQLATVRDGDLGLWMRRWFGLPYLVYAHGNEILEALESTWPKVRLSLQNAHRVVAVSRFTAALVEKAGVDPDRVEIMHPGCDVQHFRPLPTNVHLQQTLFGSRQPTHVILTVGNLVTRKGHDTVLQALPRVRQSLPSVAYLIVGDGPNRNSLEILARELGVADSVIFAGRAQSEDLPQIYALADVFIMPSREQLETCDVEGFGMVYIEANACGKPVIGGRSGGTTDAIIDGVTGFLVNPLDPEAVAQLLIKLLTDADLARNLGQQGRSRAVAEFSWPKVGDRVREILDSMLKENSIRRSLSHNNSA